MLALVLATEHFSFYLSGVHFWARSDHECLQHFMTATRLSPRLARWRLRMELYDFTVLYRRGSLHGNADALSRMNFDELAQLAADSSDEETDIIIFIISLEFEASTQHAGLFGSNLALEQDTDATLVWMKQRLAMDTSQINEEETELNVQQAKLLTAKKQFVLIKSVLYVRDGRPDGNGHFFRFVVPESAVNLVMRHVHCTATNGHLGVRKSTTKVQERFWWLGWREAIFDHF